MLIVALIICSFVNHITLLAESAAISSVNYADVYLVLLRGAAPVLHYDGNMAEFQIPPSNSAGRPDMSSEAAQRYKSFIVGSHDNLLQTTLGTGTHKKIYSYHYLINGFSALLTSEQAEALHNHPDVVSIERDRLLNKMTTYTPQYMGLPDGAWADSGGVDHAGDGIVIGFVDTGINPLHPSFTDKWPAESTDDVVHRLPYTFPTHFSGTCDVAPDFPRGSCNNKLVGARHFAHALIASGLFDPEQDSESPFDGDGHGSHTASTAAGNSHVPVIIDGMNFGYASGIAPRAHIAIYKSLFRNVGGYFSDTVAAMDQAVQDGVDILSLSIGPADPPPGVATFFSAMEIAALSAVKAGVFVVQAAGNSGPRPGTVASYSPWIFTVGAAVHNRTYHNNVLLENGETIKGIGLSPPTEGTELYELVTAADAAKHHINRTKASTCQDVELLDARHVEGRILICTYTMEFVNGGASLHKLVLTAKRARVRAVVSAVARLTADSDLGPFPSTLPAVLVPTLRESSLIMAYYYNYTSSDKRPKGRILGGLEPTYMKRATQVASYSSRGPDLANDKREVAEFMKPDVMAPGDMIWAAWSPRGNDDDNFAGANFALQSGTSMAAPHVAGVAALVKQKRPWLSPTSIASSLTTTASQNNDVDNLPIQAQRPSYNLSLVVGIASPFDLGGGEVNPTSAMDPGLVFDAGFRDYVDFLCSIPGGAPEVLKSTGATCGSATPISGADVNKPSITVANLTTRTVKRTLTNVAVKGEVYRVTAIESPEGVNVSVSPTIFHVAGDEDERRCASPWWRCHISRRVELSVNLTATSPSSYPSFGSVVLSGHLGHRVRIPLSVISRSMPI